MATNEETKFWLQVYYLCHTGNKEDEDQAILMTLARLENVMKDMRSKTRNSRQRDHEDLIQSMRFIVLEELRHYTPYVSDAATGGTKFVSGVTYFYPRFLGCVSDFCRGGDGLGNGSVPKHHIRTKGNPETYSIDEEIQNPESAVSRFLIESATESAEDIFFNNYVPSDRKEFLIGLIKSDMDPRIQRRRATLYMSLETAKERAREKYS